MCKVQTKPKDNKDFSYKLYQNKKKKEAELILWWRVIDLWIYIN